MPRFWASWWTDEIPDSDTVPFTFFVSGSRGEDNKQEACIVALLEVDKPARIYMAANKFFHMTDWRFCDEKPDDWSPGDRFEGPYNMSVDWPDTPPILEMTDIQQKVLQLILRERSRQDRKFPNQQHTNIFWAAILGEEVGEVQQAVLQSSLESKSPDRVKEEVIQACAVCFVWLERILSSDKFDRANWMVHGKE